MTEQFFRVRKGLTVANSSASANLDPLTLTIGTLTANSTLVNTAAINVTGTVNTAGLNVSGTANIGTVNATNLNLTGLVNVVALNVVNQINTATFFAATSANVGTAVINSLGVFHGGLVNASSFTVGSTFIANTTQLTITGKFSANGALGSAAQLLTANSLGGVYWSTIAGVSAGGANTQVQFNNSTAFGGSAGFTFNTATNNATIANTLTIGTATINTTNYTATANNALNLGGTAAASYQLNSTLSANVATLTANNATNLGGVAASGYLTKATADQIITGGGTVTELSLGTISTGIVTPDPGDRPMQVYTNNGAHTLGAAANSGAYLLTITNGATPGGITTSTWTKVSGDTFTVTVGHKFRCHCSIGAGGSLLVVQAMQ